MCKGEWITLAVATLTTTACQKITKCNLVPLTTGIPLTTNCVTMMQGTSVYYSERHKRNDLLMGACKRGTLRMTNNYISTHTKFTTRTPMVYHGSVFNFAPYVLTYCPPIPIYHFPKLLSQFSTIHNNSPSICNSNHIYKHDMDNKGIPQTCLRLPW